MNQKRWVLALSWMFLAALNASGVRAEGARNACISCHEVLGGTLAMPVAKWRKSVHRLEGISCVRCHGGQATVEVGDVFKLTGTEFAALKAASMSKAQGFIGKPSGQDLFNVCARCHSPMVMMYASSIMGKAYLQNKGGPSCVVCHHAHDNIIPAVPKACMKCHKDTVGFTEINPMDVTKGTIAQLSKIRIRLAGEKTQGARPAMVPGFRGKLSSYQVGLMAFGAVIFLFLICYVLYAVLEREK